MKHQKKLIFSVVFCLLIASFGLILNESIVLAAEKPSLSITEMEVPIGKMNKNVSYKRESDYTTSDPKIYVENKKKGATYEFTSSNKKIVTIGKNGGYLTALKAGSTTIVCKETYKKKTTVVGKCKVVVKNSKVISDPYFSDFVLGTGLLGVEVEDDGYYNVPLPFYIEFLNPQAKYKFKTNSKNVTFESAKLTKEEKSKYSISDQFMIRYTAKKAGTYKISVTETYKNKTKTIGSFNLRIHDATVHETFQLPVNSSESVFNLIDYTRNISYYFEVENFDNENMDNNVVSLFKNDYGSLQIRGLKLGTATLKIYESDKDGRYIGSCVINVVKIPAESIEADRTEYTVDVGYDMFYIYFYIEPYNTTDELELTSSDSSVLKVEKDEEGYWKYTPLAQGEVVITAKVGKHTTSCVVYVK